MTSAPSTPDTTTSASSRAPARFIPKNANWKARLSTMRENTALPALAGSSETDLTNIHTSMYVDVMVKPGEEARERLIEGTRQLLWDRGYVGTSPTAILEHSGVGQGSMYHHFKGKPNLVLAAEERSAELMQEQMRQVFGTDASATDKISTYLLRERDVLRGCSVGRLTADPEVMADDTLRAPVRQTFSVLHQHLVEAIVDGCASGEFASDLDADEIASTIAAVVQGGYALARAEQSVAPFDRAVQGAIALLRSSAPRHA